MYYLVMVQAQSWASAHDERDYEFASKFNLPINEVISVEIFKRSIHRCW